MFVGGSFTSPFQYNCYVETTLSTNLAIDTTLSVNSPILRGCGFYNGTTYILTHTQGVYQSSATQSWISLGTPQTSYIPTYIGFIYGAIKVGYSNYSYIMERVILSQSASWSLSSGNFKWNASTYTSYLISIPDQGQTFVGYIISGVGYWYQTGYNPYGSFS